MQMLYINRLCNSKAIAYYATRIIWIILNKANITNELKKQSLKSHICNSYKLKVAKPYVYINESEISLLVFHMFLSSLYVQITIQHPDVCKLHISSDTCLVYLNPYEFQRFNIDLRFLVSNY